jgi:hypothetical protein
MLIYLRVPGSKVKVIAKKSTDIRVKGELAQDEQWDMDERADILVSEVFDSVLRKPLCVIH